MTDYMPDWAYDQGTDADEDQITCCLCSCVIGEEVGLGERNYGGPGRHACDSCVGGHEDEREV